MHQNSTALHFKEDVNHAQRQLADFLLLGYEIGALYWPQIKLSAHSSKNSAFLTHLVV